MDDRDESITWQASEYIHHEKGPVWFVVFGLVIAALLVAVYFLIEDIISIVVIILMAIMVIIYANRKPKTLRYTLNYEGLTIEEKNYPYEVFRSFSIVNDRGVQSIYLEPIERFMPPISVYFLPEDAGRIVNMMGMHLPASQKEQDFFDSLVRKLRL